MCEGQALVVALPLRCQKSALRLSALLSIVRSRTSQYWTKAWRCRRPPASSKSELDIVPLGFSAVMSCLLMESGHSIRQTMGFVVYPSRQAICDGTNQTPPAPAPEAS